MSQRLKHALHNEEATRLLRTKPKFLDWIVTTSFYSALHFVEYYIFPFTHTDKGKEYEFKNIGDYKRFSNNAKSKHELRLDLVRWKCRDIEIDYEWLYNTCYSARYFDYNFPNPQMTLQLSESYLKNIRKFCHPPVTRSAIAKK